MQKTLGGDRLSSGKRMQVNLHAYQRSSHNKGYVWRNTMSPGTIVPFLVQYGTPGSTFDIDLDIDIITHPTIGPLFGSFKVDAHVFQCPVRLYHAWLHNNKLKIGMNMASVKLPQINLLAETSPDATLNLPQDNAQINPSCLLAYLGVRGIGYNSDPLGRLRQFNGIPLLAYWDIYKNYFSNKQEEVGAVIHGDNAAINQTVDDVVFNGQTVTEAGNPVIPTIVHYGDALSVTYTPPALSPDLTQITVRIATAAGLQVRKVSELANDWADDGVGNWTGTFSYAGIATVLDWTYVTPADIPLNPPRVVTFNLADIDTMRENILAHDGATAFNINNQNLLPYDFLLAEPADTNGRNTRLNTQEGLAVKTYLSDLFNNWLNTDWIDGAGGINERSRVSTVGDFFTLDDLLMGRKIYDLLNRIGISGGTYKDWIEASYTEIEWNKVESPVYWGGLIKELVFQEVVSNSESGTDTPSKQPLGTIAGKGILAKKHKGGKIVVKLEEHSLVMGLISLTPRVDYSQGNEWHTHIMTMDDFHKPAFDEIGFQELITEQLAYWDTQYVGAPTNNWVTHSAGKQPAWINYMTEVNKTYGNFAIENNEMFMTLNRRYETDNNARIKDLTTYIDPVKYNFIFADTSIDAMNFWVQVAVDMTYRAKMSGKLMPNL